MQRQPIFEDSSDEEGAEAEAPALEARVRRPWWARVRASVRQLQSSLLAPRTAEGLRALAVDLVGAPAARLPRSEADRLQWCFLHLERLVGDPRLLPAAVVAGLLAVKDLPRADLRRVLR